MSPRNHIIRNRPIRKILKKSLNLSYSIIATVFSPVFSPIIKHVIKYRKPSIYVGVRGGLGNQLFQYVFARVYSIKQNVSVKFISLQDCHLNISDLPFSGTVRTIRDHSGFRLHKFQFFHQNMLSNNLFYFLEAKFKGRDLYAESDSHRAPEDTIKGRSILFSGLFQDKSYFYSYVEQIQTDLVLKRVSPGCRRWNQQIANAPNSVSLHVRRGDYLSHPQTEGIYVNLTEAKESGYYKRAINHIKEKTGNTIHLFVFSDDIEWVKRNTEFDVESVRYVEFKNQEKNSEEDMYLMSQCRHNIMANSTFSWWGAWLNRNPNKIVIFPKHWYKKDGLAFGVDLYTPGLIHNNMLPM